MGTFKLILSLILLLFLLLLLLLLIITFIISGQLSRLSNQKTRNGLCDCLATLFKNVSHHYVLQNLTPPEELVCTPEAHFRVMSMDYGSILVLSLSLSAWMRREKGGKSADKEQQCMDGAVLLLCVCVCVCA